MWEIIQALIQVLLLKSLNYMIASCKLPSCVLEWCFVLPLWWCQHSFCKVLWKLCTLFTALHVLSYYSLFLLLTFPFMRIQMSQCDQYSPRVQGAFWWAGTRTSGDAHFPCCSSLQFRSWPPPVLSPLHGVTGHCKRSVLGVRRRAASSVDPSPNRTGVKSVFWWCSSSQSQDFHLSAFDFLG